MDKKLINRKTYFIDQIMLVIILATYFILQSYIQKNDIGSYLFNIYPGALDEKSMMILFFFILRIIIVMLFPIFIIIRILLYIKQFKSVQLVKVKVAVYFLLIVVVVSIFSIFWTPRDAKKWMSNDVELQQQFINAIRPMVHRQPDYFSVANVYGEGEWLFVTYAMAGYGYGQVAMANPKLKDSCLKEMTFCIHKLLSKEVKEFDSMAWSEDPLESLDGKNDHVAYLGYLNLLLSMHRFLDKNSEFSSLNDSITKTLVLRYENCKIGLLETYPGVIFPADNAPAIGSIGMYSKATGIDHFPFLNKWFANFQKKYVDKLTGLTYQWVKVVKLEADSVTLASLNHKSVDSLQINNDKVICSLPRGSGTAACIYFLSFADTILTKQLYQSVKEELAASMGVFGAIKEYPKMYADESGDIDSGPLIFGLGISATGFIMSGAKIFKDEKFFSQLCSIAYLVGVPANSTQKFQFTFGDKIGNTILFAMLTATKH